MDTLAERLARLGPQQLEELLRQTAEVRQMGEVALNPSSVPATPLPGAQELPNSRPGDSESSALETERHSAERAPAERLAESRRSDDAPPQAQHQSEVPESYALYGKMRAALEEADPQLLDALKPSLSKARESLLLQQDVQAIRTGMGTGEHFDDLRERLGKTLSPGQLRSLERAESVNAEARATHEAGDLAHKLQSGVEGAAQDIEHFSRAAIGRSPMLAAEVHELKELAKSDLRLASNQKALADLTKRLDFADTLCGAVSSIACSSAMYGVSDSVDKYVKDRENATERVRDAVTAPGQVAASQAAEKEDLLAQLARANVPAAFIEGLSDGRAAANDGAEPKSARPEAPADQNVSAASPPEHAQARSELDIVRDVLGPDAAQYSDQELRNVLKPELVAQIAEHGIPEGAVQSVQEHLQQRAQEQGFDPADIDRVTATAVLADAVGAEQTVKLNIDPNSGASEPTNEYDQRVLNVDTGAVLEAAREGLESDASRPETEVSSSRMHSPEMESLEQPVSTREHGAAVETASQEQTSGADLDQAGSGREMDIER